MNSDILTQLGMDNIDPAYFLIGIGVLILGLLIYIIVISTKLKKLNERYQTFMKGKDGKSIEKLVQSKIEKIDDLIARDAKKEVEIKDIKENLQITFQKVGIVKYDAFNEMGGKLSFALAMLNKDNNGFVINAMHSREGCYTYIKEIIKGESYIILGEEEKEAVDKAVKYDSFIE